MGTWATCKEVEEKHIEEERDEEIGEVEIVERSAEDSGSKVGWALSQKKAPEMQVGQLLGLRVKTLWRQGWLEKMVSWYLSDKSSVSPD